MAGSVKCFVHNRGIQSRSHIIRHRQKCTGICSFWIVRHKFFCSNLCGWGFYGVKLIFDTLCFCIPGRTASSIKVEELGLLRVCTVKCLFSTKELMIYCFYAVLFEWTGCHSHIVTSLQVGWPENWGAITEDTSYCSVGTGRYRSQGMQLTIDLHQVLKVNELYIHSPLGHFWCDVSVSRGYLSHILVARNT